MDSPVLNVVVVGAQHAERAELGARLASCARDVRVHVCEGGVEDALAISARSHVDALLVGPFAELAQLPLALLSQLLERDAPPVLLLLGAAAWAQVAWSSLPVASVDAVLAWEDCRGERLRELLRYNIARARAAARTRAALTRTATMAAATARLADASERRTLCTVAAEAALALRACGCAVLLADEDDLVLSEARGVRDEELRVLARCTVSSSQHAVAEAARTRRARWVDDASTTQGALPVMVDDALAGALWVRLPRADDDDRAALETLALHFAAALGRAQQVARLGERAAHAERLVAIVAHDLRSPLQVISMASGLLRLDGAVAPAKRYLLDRVDECAGRSSGLVDELLTVAQTRAGVSPAELADSAVFAVLESCVRDFLLRMPDCPVALSTRGDDRAMIHREHVAQVLHNLLANAAHYRASGSTVEVRGLGATNHVYLEVQNRGPAIEAAQMADLFAPMKRGARGGERGSVGLGLYIVKSVVEADGGRVWARSSAEEGTTFVVALPRSPPCAPHPPVCAPLAPLRSTSPSVPPAYAALLARLPEGPLVQLLGIWLELGGAGYLPHPRSLQRARLLAYLPDMFWVDVLRDPSSRMEFRLTEIGGALERRLDGHPADEVLHLAADDLLPPSMRAAYERCATTRRPAFDYLKRRGADEATSASFTRLVLPFSRDGEHVTQLVGMALFRGFDDASHTYEETSS